MKSDAFSLWVGFICIYSSISPFSVLLHAFISFILSLFFLSFFLFFLPEMEIIAVLRVVVSNSNIVHNYSTAS